MDTIERIHKKIEELAKLTQKAFPSYSQAMFSVNPKGQLSLSVTEWDADKSDVPVEKQLRRSLWDQSKSANKDEWNEEYSDTMNQYFAERGTLKEG